MRARASRNLDFVSFTCGGHGGGGGEDVGGEAEVEDAERKEVLKSAGEWVRRWTNEAAGAREIDAQMKAYGWSSQC